MGTRHQQIVIAKSGDVKISQYGQWDGYPDGQGLGILGYLRKGNLITYEKNVEQIPVITDEQIEAVDNDPQWKLNYPYLSRDCGSDIHEMIEKGEVKFVQHIENDEARKWCEGFYTIDLAKREFRSEFYGTSATFSLDNLPTDEEYLAAMQDEE